MSGLPEGFENQLNDLGVTAKVHAVLPSGPRVQRAAVRLSRGESAKKYTLTFGSDVKPGDSVGVDGSDAPMLVFTRFVAPKSAETFRRAGVQYLDEVGNAWIEFGDVLVDIRGQRRPAGISQPTYTRAGSLFSTSRAQVVFALLAWPGLWDAPQRDLAHAAGVSLGQAHNTLAMLAELGYGRDRNRAGQTRLVDLWAAAFPTGLAKKLTLATYRGDVNAVKKANADDPVFLSGEGAAEDLLRPSTLTVYVEELDPRLPIVNRWRSDGPPNIVVRRKFWHAPDGSDVPLAGLPLVPPPLIYADLLASDDPRVRDVAKVWRDDRLA